MSSPSVRVLVHALDRTGPPMLALAFLRWVRQHRPDASISVVAFRGGALLDTFSDVAPTHVLVDPSEPWDHTAPDPERLATTRHRAAALAPADVMLSVSVAGGQVLPSLPDPIPPLVTWSVEQGEDLHWIDDPIGLRDGTARWLAGSAGTEAELRERLGADASIHLAPEFIADSGRPDDAAIAHRRASLGAGPDDLLVLGAGIATVRKAPDLFVEAAVRSGRVHPDRRFVWLGGEHDTMFTTVVAESRRLGIDTVRFLGNVVDVEPWLAAADVLLHTARLDAFPLVCLHAALMGTPVVGFSGVGGLAEMFGPAALTAPYPDLTGLLDHVDRLRDPDERRRAGAAQAARVRASFTSDEAAPTVWRHLEEIAGGAV